MAKKALILTLALLCAFAVPAMAQQKKASGEKKSSIATAPAHMEINDFGSRWSGMSDKERHGFLLGMATAFRVVCMNVAAGDGTNKDPADYNKNVMMCISNVMPYQIAPIIEAMTSLYQDKTNNRISFDAIYGVALLKMAGKPFDESLAQQRKLADALGKGLK